jgi:hypothetical protein
MSANWRVWLTPVCARGVKRAVFTSLNHAVGFHRHDRLIANAAGWLNA